MRSLRNGAGVLATVLVAGVATASAAGAEAAAPANPTFTRDILPIFQKSCQACHRPGQMAPFALLTYEDARPWARSIKNKVETRYMPPWHLDRTVGEYNPDPSLSDEQIAIISKWVDNGAPKGDPKDAPPPVPWPADHTWQFGEEPDVILKTPAFDVPAQWADLYPEPEIESGNTEDRYIKWIQVLPGDTKVTHHVLVFSLSKPGSQGSSSSQGSPGPQSSAGSSTPVDINALAAQFGIDIGTIDPAVLRAQFARFAAGGIPTMLTEYARGNDGDIFTETEAKLLAKDAKVRFQIHYHPNGEKAVLGDQAIVGIKFWPKGFKPAHLIQTRNIQNMEALAIPPGEANARSDAYFVLTQPARLVSFQPHMHYRGKRMTLEAIPPSGQPQLLTDVNHFVWTWQITYPYKNPPAFPKGTVLHVTAYHDNSPANKENPDPSAFIGWGDRTVDEMNIGWLDYYFISDQEYAEIQAKQRATRRSTGQ